MNKESIISHISSKHVITIEEHSEIGGLGSAIADILCENSLNNILLKKIALKDKCHTDIGSQKFLRKLNGLDSNQIVIKIIDLIKNGQK